MEKHEECKWLLSSRPRFQFNPGKFQRGAGKEPGMAQRGKGKKHFPDWRIPTFPKLENSHKAIPKLENSHIFQTGEFPWNVSDWRIPTFPRLENFQGPAPTKFHSSSPAVNPDFQSQFPISISKTQSEFPISISKPLFQSQLSNPSSHPNF